MSLDLLKERFGHSVKKETDNKEKIHEQLTGKFNSNSMDGLKDFKAQHQEELYEKERVIENLEIEATKLANQVLTLEREKSTIIQELNNSKWMENNIASKTKKMYEEKIRTMSYVDSTELIPTLIEVSRKKQGNELLNWGKWLEIPENKYLLQINENVARKVFQDTTALIKRYISNINDTYRSELIEAGRTSRTRGGDEPAVDTDYILTFAGDTVDDFVETTFNPDNYDGTGTGLNHGFTVSFWIKPDEIGGFRQALGRRSETNGRFHFGTKSALLVHVGAGQSNAKTDNTHNGDVETGHEMEVGNWYNWVVTYGGDDHEDIGGDRHVRIWINGKEIYKDGADSGTGNENGMGTSNWKPTWTNNLDGAENVYFGARTDFNGLPDSPYSQGWACSLSEVAIYNTEIDEDGTFANAVYDAGWGYDHRNNSNSSNLVGYWRLNEGDGTLVKDLSGNDNHGTLTTEGSQIPTWTKNTEY